MVNHVEHPKKFFSPEEENRIVQAIQKAEHQTSGEIRVYLARTAKGDPLKAAKKIFGKLKMHRTKERSGVLIYLALKDRSFAILGDQGIHEKVGHDFWGGAARKMEEAFKREDFAAGLEGAILEVGERLKTHFPWQQGDRNELPDTIQEG